MLRTTRYILAIASVTSMANAGSMVEIGTFTDNRCNTKSTTSPNVSLPLDACVITVGMGSFQVPTTPCGGGGASSVQRFAFEGTSCSDTWLGYFNYGGGCSGTSSSGEVIGSILLTCKDNDGLTPNPDGTTTTIQVGPVATDSAPTAAAASSGVATSSSGVSPTHTPDSGNDSGSESKPSSECTGSWNCLTYAEKIGIIVALSVGIPPILLGLLALRWRRKKAQRNRPHPEPPQQHPSVHKPMTDVERWTQMNNANNYNVAQNNNNMLNNPLYGGGGS